MTDIATDISRSFLPSVNVYWFSQASAFRWHNYEVGEVAMN